MKLFDEDGKTIWVCTQSVQPWMIDWTKLSGNAMSISLIEDMIRSFLTIYMLRQYPGDYITAIELYGFATQYADYIYYSNRDDVIEEA